MTQEMLWAGAGASLAMAVTAAAGERARKRRADLDHVGLIDWPTVQVAAILMLLLCAGLIMRG